MLIAYSGALQNGIDVYPNPGDSNMGVASTLNFVLANSRLQNGIDIGSNPEDSNALL